MTDDENGNNVSDKQNNKLTNKELLEEESGSSNNSNAGFYNKYDEAPKSFGERTKNTFWGSKFRKRATVSGGAVGLLTGGSILFLLLTSASAQLIQLSHVLQRDFEGMNVATSSRFNRIIEYSGRDIGETRLSVLDRQFIRPTLDKLSAQGVDFSTNSTGGLKGVTIDPAKLASANPDFKGLSIDEQKAKIADIFNIDAAKVTVNKGSTLSINASEYGNSTEFPSAVTRLIKNGSVDILGNGQILSAINKRVMVKYFDVPSLFHPFKAAKAATRKGVTAAVESRSSEDEEVTTDIVDPEATATGLSGVTDSLKSKFGGSVGNSITAALIGTAAICTIRSASGDIVSFNRAAIVLPAALEATRLIAAGSQVESGQDLTAGEVGGLVNSLTDSQGKNVWGAKSLQVTENSQQPSGPDIPTEYAQAFSGNTTANNINNAFNLNLGPLNITGAACSAPGLVIQGLASIVLLIAAAPSDGSSLAIYAATKGAETAGFVGATYLLQHQLENILKDNAVVPHLLSGPLGGNLLAYGAREAGNIGARAEGGVPLSNSDTSKVIGYEQNFAEKQFRAQGFFARMFDINNSQSFLGKLADAFSPKLSTNITNLASDILNIGQLFGKAFTSIIPHASADTTYNWNFSVDGIPSSILNSSDPTMQNPYNNADVVAKVLDSSAGSQYISRAQACFGVSINNTSGSWDVVPTSDVNPDSDTYVSANCSDISDPTWQRIILFVLDTRTMQATACYDGDATSCSEVGY